MCGICGILNQKKQKQIEQDIIHKMLKVIAHRGPDGARSWGDKDIVLGFCRLSFIDLSGGMQPLSNENGSIYMVCNGEIFNYIELREDLLMRGHSFKTKTDIEVIIHLYEEYGEKFVERLNGQFAIALYDAKTKTLYLYRDQFGIAPLFYAKFDGRLIFASEIKSILTYPNFERKVNLIALDQVMNFPGIVSPNTFFKGVYSVKSGHYLKIDNEKIEDNEYWDINYSKDNEDLGEEYYVEHLKEILIRAIKCRLKADVPIGFYISGGLDSAIIACFINKYISSSHDSFSAEVGSTNYSERAFQLIVQKHIKSIHHSVKITEDELWEYMPKVIYHTETALRESYDVAAFLLSKLVHTTPVRAVLTGQGADEFFNGYIGYVSDSFRRMRKSQMSAQECELNERLWGDPFFRYERDHDKTSRFNRSLYSSEIRASYNEFSALNESPIDLEKVRGLGTQRRRSYIDSKLRLADHLLGDHGDRMFFANSVEGRHPFLDTELIDFVINIPEKYKLRGANAKYILKKVAEGIVPDEVINRKKFPFSTPGMSYMLKRNETLGDKYLSKEVIKKQGIFEWSLVNALKEQYSASNFRLEGTYEIDYLQIILSTTLLMEKFSLSI